MRSSLNTTLAKSAPHLPLVNKTFVHIDKNGVFDPQQYYIDAGLNVEKLTELCARLWESMADLYRSVFGEDFSGDVYAGEDIKILASLRDQAESRLS